MASLCTTSLAQFVEWFGTAVVVPTCLCGCMESDRKGEPQWIPNEIDDIGSTRAEWSSSPFAMRGSLKLLFFLTPLAQLRECGSTAVVVPMCLRGDLESDDKGGACV